MSGGFAELYDSPDIILILTFLSRNFRVRIVFSRVSFAVILPAIRTNTVNLKGVASGQVLVLATDLLLEFSNLGREKFN